MDLISIDDPCFCKNRILLLDFNISNLNLFKDEFGIEFELQYSERKGDRIK